MRTSSLYVEGRTAQGQLVDSVRLHGGPLKQRESSGRPLLFELLDVNASKYVRLTFDGQTDLPVRDRLRVEANLRDASRLRPLLLDLNATITSRLSSGSDDAAFGRCGLYLADLLECFGSASKAEAPECATSLTGEHADDALACVDALEHLPPPGRRLGHG
jgi:hypothetical protein